jgi:CRP-like cAMP-binding protein
LQTIGVPFEYLYFVERGIVSLVRSMLDGQTVEVAAIGIEGIANSSGLFDSSAAIFEAVVQVPGNALRIGHAKIARFLSEDRELAGLMHRYTAVALSQMGQMAACNALHSIDERCCRWLLTAHDSALGDTFPITQEYLAAMLGVARTSVSLTEIVLQQAGVIHYSRGSVTIVNRPALERSACECYAAIKREIESLFASAMLDT